ncbi:MAG: aminoacyl-tRNA hydrolase [Kiritimatiellaeota bacterium]|nr:aminoacyl-tRNA hydrolase [Kiritimatiellota bacterium]
MQITRNIILPAGEVEIHAVRSSGPGGQNVNKVSTTAHLRFDIRASSLPERAKTALLASRDSRVNGNGVLVLKASKHRTLVKNRKDALERLAALIRSVLVKRKKRRGTKPTVRANEKRLKTKSNRSKIKRLRKQAVADSD